MPVRALVCDDDTPIRMMVKDLLDSMGVEVVEARDGQEALAVFMREPVDLVVVDFLMPKVDGLQVIRGIRAHATRSHVPVVLMSAISRAQIMAEGGEQEPDIYVNKPFKPKKMAKVLEQLLRRLRDPT